MNFFLKNKFYILTKNTLQIVTHFVFLPFFPFIFFFFISIHIKSNFLYLIIFKLYLEDYFVLVKLLLNLFSFYLFFFLYRVFFTIQRPELTHVTLKINLFFDKKIRPVPTFLSSLAIWRCTYHSSHLKLKTC